jgi:hypothetical protein
MRQEGIMAQRGVEKVSTNLPIDYSLGGERHEGVVKNFSEEGMCINVRACPPSGTDIEVSLILGDEVFNLTGRVNRTLSTGKFSGIMSVDIAEPPESYCRFISVVRDYACPKPSSRMVRRTREKVAS